MGSGDIDAVAVRDERQQDAAGNIIRVLIVKVPTSETYPEGIKYAFYYGSPASETFLRYDNAHGTHERHTGDTVEQIDFPGASALYRRFRRNVDAMDPEDTE
jgi:hypothetical protein